MDTIIWILILLTAFNFLLKQTFWPTKGVWLAAVAGAVFVVLTWPYAIEQSKTQIADWLSDSALMLDIAVVLTVEVALQMAFCLLTVHTMNVSPLGKRVWWAWKVLYWFPGILIFPVLFFSLTQLIFALPGISFQQVAWGFGGVVLVVVPAGRWLVKWLVPEEDLRLELLFLTNALVAILGVIATVNGRTAIEGTATVDWTALAGCAGIFAAGAVIGLLWRKWRGKRI
ncbi:hypothetical protein [Odoribacter lunatus]|uniref:hypothetical protein n=1 Tax=Odoribacter lunatus TaxID=2941335 RepID=UPI00203C79A5|nr:hypothetical protein [Odoribacter lunatus]